MLRYVDDLDELRGCGGLMVLLLRTRNAPGTGGEAFSLAYYLCDKPFAPNLITAQKIFDRADAIMFL